MDERLLELRDIHLPAQQGADLVQFAPWPFALFAALCGSIALAIWRRRTLWRRQFFAELAQIERLSQRDAVGAWQRLASLLRRLAIHLQGSGDAAQCTVERITGERWLVHLDRVFVCQSFTAGPGRALIDIPYAPRDSGCEPPLRERSAQDLHELISIVRRRVSAVRP